MSLVKTKSDMLAKDFTLEGLREYLLDNLDVESYSDSAITDVLEEFLFQLTLRVKSTAEALASCGVEFFWAVYLEDAVISPREAELNYSFTAPGGKLFQGINAIVASIVYDLDIDALTENYWLTKTLKQVA